MAPVARGLSGSFRVLEPWQRGSSETPLTVSRHVEDLHELIETRCPADRPALLGSSWGAMLSLAYAAEHPDRAGALVLVGCGTFDVDARRKMEETIRQRMSASLRRRIDRLARDIPDPDRRFEALGRLLLPVYSYDATGDDMDMEQCDERAFRETWTDMLRLQREGMYPAAFSAITTPVLMVHGAADPHPGRRIRDSLARHIPQLEYLELKRCGHYPWLEKHVRDRFFHDVIAWLGRRLVYD